MPSKKIKVVFMGTPHFALPSLQSLISDPDFNLQTVITQEDKKVGRKQLLTPPPVKLMAVHNSIPVLQPPTLRNNAEITGLIKGLKPDFIVVVAYGQILPPEILAIPRYGCINLHGSLLPKYRGASPVEESLLHGDSETGITFIQMDSKLDSGDILLVRRVPIKPEDNAIILREKLCLVGGQLLPFLLRDIIDGIIVPIPQNHSKATFCRKIRKENGLLKLDELTAVDIVNRIRAYTPWPNCFLIHKGKRLKILEAAADENSASVKAKPGEAVFTGNNQIALVTKKGLLIPKTVQLEGKKALPVQDFLRGNPGFFE